MKSTNPLALLVLIIIGALALPAPANAHAVLVSSSPKDKAVLKTSPKTVMLRFDARIEKRLSQVTLLDGKGHKVKLPSQHGYAAGSPAQLIIAVPKLRPDSYKVEYQSWPPTATLLPVSFASQSSESNTSRGRRQSALILLSAFLDVFLRALTFVGLALSVGGIVFRYVVARPLEAAGDIADAAVRRMSSLIAVGAFLVAVSGLSALATSLSALADASGRWPLAEFLGADFAWAGMIHAALSFCLGFAALRCRRNSPTAWAVAALFGAAVMAAGAWLTHGASRLDNRAALMSVTVIHQFAAVAWVGGVIHLAAQWSLLSRDGVAEEIWPYLTGRFSPMAAGSVALLVASGIYLYVEYIRDAAGLVGTAYGAMLITKVALLAAMLFLAQMNMTAIRHWKLTGDRRELLRKVPIFAEVEVGIGVIVLMAAAALTGQPPAVDLASERATPAEVIQALAPKMPQLIPPPHSKMLAGLHLRWILTRCRPTFKRFRATSTTTFPGSS